MFDPLSGFFFALVGVVVISIACYDNNSLRGFGYFFTGLFASGMYLVLLAQDVFTFMLVWELILYVLIRFKIFAGLVLANNLSDNLMIIFGLSSFAVAAIMLQRQRDIKRLFAYSSIEHIGLITFIFGLGGAYVGLFYLLMHSLVKSAIFVIIGNIVQQTKTKILETIRGLITSDPKLGWTLIIATLAIAGMPPFGIFTSELMLFIICMQFNPWLVIILFSGFIFCNIWDMA